jgi:hypothetical protein
MCGRQLLAAVLAGLLALVGAQDTALCSATGPRVACGGWLPSAVLAQVCRRLQAISALRTPLKYRKHQTCRVARAAAARELLSDLPASLPPLTAAPPCTAGPRGVDGPSCETLGCCWAINALPKEDWQSDVYLPQCFYPNRGQSTYNLVDRGQGTIQQTGGAGVLLGWVLELPV